MRVLIISDTHGRHTAFDRAIMEAGKIDYLVHLGDTEGGEDYIEAFCGCPAYTPNLLSGFTADIVASLPCFLWKLSRAFMSTSETPSP